MSSPVTQPEDEERGAEQTPRGEQLAPGEALPRGEQLAHAEGLAPAERLSRVRALCEETLTHNWTQGEHGRLQFAYTQPSPERYRWQWYWDSCFAAIVWRRFDAQRSRRELSTLLAAAREDGFIGHTIFWSGH